MRVAKVLLHGTHVAREKTAESAVSDASEEVKKYGLGGLVTPSSIDDEGDVSYASKSPNQTDFLKKERDKLNIKPHVLEVMEKADKKNKLVEASRKDKFGMAAEDKISFDTSKGKKLKKELEPKFLALRAKDATKLEKVGRQSPDPDPTKASSLPILPETLFFKRTSVNIKQAAQRSIPHHLDEYDVHVDTDHHTKAKVSFTLPSIRIL